MSRVILQSKDLGYDGKFFLIQKTQLNKLQLVIPQFLFFLLRFDFFCSNLRKQFDVSICSLLAAHCIVLAASFSLNTIHDTSICSLLVARLSPYAAPGLFLLNVLNFAFLDGRVSYLFIFVVQTCAACSSSTLLAFLLFTACYSLLPQCYSLSATCSSLLGVRFCASRYRSVFRTTLLAACYLLHAASYCLLAAQG